MSSKIRAAVIGAGAFGRNHVRVLSQMPEVELIAVADLNIERARELAAEYGTSAVANIDELPDPIEAAIIATPTITHEAVAARLLGAGVDVLVEKPIADSVEAGARLARLADENGQILQVGHLERFNPAVVKLEKERTIPLFFEIHRLSVFTPRSLDIDVVLDLMIHDLDIVLNLVGEMPKEIRAAGNFDSLAEGRYRQCAVGIRQRLRRESYRKPRLHRAGAQAAAFPAGRILFSRLQAAGDSQSANLGKRA